MSKKEYKSLLEFGRHTKKTSFVLYTPEKDDYFVQMENNGVVTAIGWTQTPEYATKFNTFEEAEKVGYDIMKGRENKYRLQICQLHESESQFGVHPIAEISDNPDSISDKLPIN